MPIAEIAVTVGGVGAIAFLAWFFFGPRQAQAAQVKGNVQEIEVKVKGGYSPDIIRVKKGVPLKLIFDRQEAGDCSSRVVFPDFHASKTLPAFARTTLEFTPDKAGEFGFACGMNMVHGTLVVEEGQEPAVAPIPEKGEGKTHEHALAVGVGPTMPVGKTEQVEFALVGGGVTCPTCAVNIETALKDLPGMDDVRVNFGAERITARYDPEQVSAEQMQQIIEDTGYKVNLREEPGTRETEDREAADRRAERKDLTRRVIVGAILTAPPHRRYEHTRHHWHDSCLWLQPGGYHSPGCTA